LDAVAADGAVDGKREWNRAAAPLYPNTYFKDTFTDDRIDVHVTGYDLEGVCAGRKAILMPRMPLASSAPA
jgi:hypothetical protein